MLRAPISLALFKQCYERYGEAQALIDTVAEFVARNEKAMADLASGTDGVAALSEGAKLDLEEEAMDRTRAMAYSAGACAEASARVAAG